MFAVYALVGERGANGNFRINGINADVAGTPQQLQLDNLTADIYEGHLTGRATLFRERVPRLKLVFVGAGPLLRSLLLAWDEARINRKAQRPCEAAGSSD